jgi:hypothetical protein
MLSSGSKNQLVKLCHAKPIDLAVMFYLHFPLLPENVFATYPNDLCLRSCSGVLVRSRLNSVPHWDHGLFYK